MTKTYVVSGQGIRYPEQRYRLPAHVEVHFYRQRRRAPQIYKPRTILDELMVEVGVFPDWIAEPGEFVPFHCCWTSPTAAPRSGVFRRSSGDLVIDLMGTSAAEPVSLWHIVDQVAHGRETRMTVIHWLVRSEQSDAANAPALNFQRPLRLLQGNSRDIDESRHVPLVVLGEHADK